MAEIAQEGTAVDEVPRAWCDGDEQRCCGRVHAQYSMEIMGVMVAGCKCGWEVGWREGVVSGRGWSWTFPLAASRVHNIERWL